MGWWWAVLGAGVLGVVVLDMLWTTVAATAGAGPLTTTVSTRLWDLARRLCLRRRRRHVAMRTAGVLVVLSVFLTWVAGTVLGWWLVLVSSPAAVVDTSTGEPVTASERLYVAGYVVATLGNGEYRPGLGVWQAVVVLGALTGLAVVTLSITYLVPVTGAVTDRRTLALELSSLGGDAAEVVLSGAAGERGWHALEQQLAAFAQPLHRTGQRHLAYPVLHHFHDVEPHAALAPRVAVLDDALLLLSAGVHPDHRPDPLPLQVTTAGVGSLLDTLAAAHITPVDEPPPAPDLARLRAAGVPTVSDAEFAAAVEARADRRRLLGGFVHDDGWDWDAVCAPGVELGADGAPGTERPDDLRRSSPPTG
ncbi:MAG: hypothetical protein ACLGIR_07390 [Actinomycetes bacterium]